MKTRNKLQQSGGITLMSIAIAGVLFLASCQKDELLNPSSTNSASSDRISAAPIGSTNSVDRSTRPFIIVNIEHQSGLSHTPTYIVSLYSEGTVIFRGIRDVGHIGTFKYNVPLNAVGKIQNLMSEVFYEIEGQAYVPDKMLVVTTYQRARDVRPRQLIDYNTSEQAKLVWLRQSVESILKTDAYVKEGTLNLFNFPAEY